MKVKSTVSAWLQKGINVTPAQLQTPEGAADLSFFRSGVSMAGYGYLYIGEAEITVDVPDERAVVDNAVASLREQAAALRAETTAKCTAIEGQIQQLLAIEFKPAAAEQQ